MTITREPITAYLNLLAGAEPAGGYLELRWRRDGGMGQAFYPTGGRFDEAVTTIRRLGGRTDVYVGAAPRTRRAGGKDAICRSHVVWADLDSPEAIARSERFTPRPSMVVSSGRGNHCYWSLRPPVGPEALEQANRRLVDALAGDPRSADAARILRPPGSTNHKWGKPVVLEQLSGEVFELDYVVGNLPDPSPPSPPQRSDVRRLFGNDPLESILPADYFRVLAGREPDRSHKVLCPVHREHTPSCHVYDTPEDGWYCYGCGAGGRIYDLGSALWGIGTRGRDFHRLRERLAAAFHTPLDTTRRRATR